jgi:PPOX class probable F420-dependent enzyme
MIARDERPRRSRVIIDPGTEKGARVDARLRDELVVWLVTVAADGTPVPTPVWFWWDGATILVYSQPGTPKLRHIAANPRVAIAMRTDEHGDALVVISGTALVDPGAPPAHELAEYLAKYGASIERLGSTPAEFGTEYEVPIRITPTRLRAW